MDYTPKYYDLVLAGVVVAMATGALVGLVTDLPLSATVTGFGVVAALIIGHALFVNGPVEDVEDLGEEFDGLN